MSTVPLHPLYFLHFIASTVPLRPHSAHTCMLFSRICVAGVHELELLYSDILYTLYFIYFVAGVHELELRMLHHIWTSRGRGAAANPYSLSRVEAVDPGRALPAFLFKARPGHEGCQN